MYPYYSQPSPQGNPYQTGLQNVKGFFRKPLILVAAIVYSVFTLSTIAANVVQILDYTRIYGNLYNAAASYINVAVSSLVMLLICLAVWLIYLKSRSSKSTASPSAGLTILYVDAVIALVLVCLLVALCLIAVIGIVAAGGNSSFFWDALGNYGYSYQLAYSIGAPMLILIVAIVMTVLILYVVSILRFVGSARRSLHSSAMYKGGSIASGIFFSLTSLGTISILIEYITNTYSSPLLKILLIVNAVLSLAFLVLMAVVCFAYYSYCSKTNYAAIAAAPRAEAYQGGYPPVQPNPYGGLYAPYGQPQQPQPNQQGQNGQNPYYGTPYGGQPNPYAPPAPAAPYGAAGQSSPQQQGVSPYAAPYQEPSSQPINDSLPVESAPVQSASEEGLADLYSDSSAEQARYAPEAPSAPPVQPEPEKNIWEPVPSPEEGPAEPEAPVFASAPEAEPAAGPAAAPVSAESVPAETGAEEVRCPACGASLPKGSHFCFRCGGRVD